MRNNKPPFEAMPTRTRLTDDEMIALFGTSLVMLCQVEADQRKQAKPDPEYLDLLSAVEKLRRTLHMPDDVFQSFKAMARTGRWKKPGRGDFAPDGTQGAR